MQTASDCALAFGGNKWLVVGSGAFNTTNIGLLRARVRLVEFR